jgi:hypothetical protein
MALSSAASLSKDSGRPARFVVDAAVDFIRFTIECLTNYLKAVREVF